MSPLTAGGPSAPNADRNVSERFRPFGTIRCSNPSYYRNQLARDLGCLLDVDDDVVAWCCRPYGLDDVLIGIGWNGPPPDFMATYRDGREVFLHAVDHKGDPGVTEAAACHRMWHRFVTAADIRAGYRLQNSKDLLRYANFLCPLGDRIRLLAALEQEGSASLAECLGLFREISPMAGLSTLILRRFVTIDLDAELIAPHTEVRVYRNDRHA